MVPEGVRGREPRKGMNRGEKRWGGEDERKKKEVGRRVRGKEKERKRGKRSEKRRGGNRKGMGK